MDSLPGFTSTSSDPFTLFFSSSEAASTSGPSPTSPTTTDSNGVSSSTSHSDLGTRLVSPTTSFRNSFLIPSSLVPLS
ncbi:hypothetical protein SCLCIDRAFT_1212949 [Scleroderma citrinum Foug A]|uniref:Uncharacterized protein n=1 Tax=Scleroderma citrinum Foug A TaxID=1036808 RepID=A0A0C3E8Z8_9AGAM|nr:hypothetical protein SCLCIDRAFT_1212949 [Scleroderma citrinum Foug A]